MWKYSQEFNRIMKSPFKFKKKTSNYSKSISDRENDPTKFIERITPQIKEVFKNNLPYLTPEEWDYSFQVLGGGPSRRKSYSILRRMSWETFLKEFDKITKII